MRFRVHVSSLAFLLALAVSSMTPAMADESNKETRMQTNVPVAIPGRVLQPGTYIFRLAESMSNRNIVQIFSEDANGRETLVTTLPAISAYRTQTPEKPIFNVEQRVAGGPEAIHTWFYPGDNTGWEFVYSKSDRLEIAKTQPPAEQPVAAVEPPSPPEEPIAAPAPEPEPVVDTAETETVVAETDSVVLAPENTFEIRNSADRVLPQTAGYSIAQLLAGMTMLGLGGLVLRAALCRNAA